MEKVNISWIPLPQIGRVFSSMLSVLLCYPIFEMIWSGDERQTFSDPELKHAGEAEQKTFSHLLSLSLSCIY